MVVSERWDWQSDRAGRTLTLQSSVLAVVPHFHCERWLPDCLDSLVKQTRPPQGIVVIDDGSGDPPVEIVAPFPQVTLLASAENVGPYRLIQQVIDETAYDAYMFQDADDWSLSDRLEISLREAERSGAEMVGCQSYRLIEVEGEVVPLTYPLDVNAALAMNPTRHAIKHPGSVVSRDLIRRIGGFSTGFRFAADTEFQCRAAHVGRMVNVPEFVYVYRVRGGSLTSDPETGIGSPERLELNQMTFDRALENASRVEAGQRPNLEPLMTAGPVVLGHVVGPRLRGVSGGAWPA